MSEIERAIELLEIAYKHSLATVGVNEATSTIELSLKLCRAELEREKNEPPKCYECKNESDSWECERCIWGDKTDRYEPKGEPNV